MFKFFAEIERFFNTLTGRLTYSQSPQIAIRRRIMYKLFRQSMKRYKL